MKGFHLTKKQLADLHAAHRCEHNKRFAYRIHAVILLGTGYTLKKVKKVLFIDDDTLRNYVNNYRIDGLVGLLSDNRSGKASKLSHDQINVLKLELDTNLHLDTLSVINFVKKTLGVRYSCSGMRDLLHRIGYVYKKPKLTPGNPDGDEQEIFSEQYEAFMLSKPDDVEVVFVDAVHPEHNTLAGYGWIKRGETRELKTNSGRERLNLHGAINAETHDVIIIESDTIDSYSTINLLSAIEGKYPGASEIKVILDNARYHYSKKVRQYLSQSRVDLVFLPSYSPNLNLIERLWKFFKKEVLYNKYHKNIEKFRGACISFFKNIDIHAHKISNFMNADFHLI